MTDPDSTVAGHPSLLPVFLTKVKMTIVMAGSATKFLALGAMRWQVNIFALLMTAYLLAGSLFPRTDLSQLGRIASLFEHYQVHKGNQAEPGQTLSFLEFLKMHFVDTDQSEAGPTYPHHNLPLQSFQSHLQLFSPASRFLPRISQRLIHVMVQHAPISLPYSTDWVSVLIQPPIA